MIHRASMLLFALPACAVGSVQDPVDPLFDPAGCLSADQSELRAELSELGPWSGELVVRNDCDGAVSLLDVQVSGDAFSVDEAPTSIGASSEQAVVVSFEPTGTGSVEGELRLRVDGSASHDLVVSLIGYVDGPHLEISEQGGPSTTPAGCVATRRLTLSNTGNLPLTITDVALSGDPDFAIEALDGPIVIAARGTSPLDVSHTGTTPGTDGLVLTFETDEPGRDTVQHALSQQTAYTNPQASTAALGAPALDVLLVVDRSSCNTLNHRAIPDALSTAQHELDGWDYRVAIVAADSGCVLGPDPFIDASMDAAAAAAVATTMIDSDFVASTYGANAERGLTLALAALSSENTTGRGCNAGTFREDAFLHIINQSDEPDQSVNDWSYYVDAYQEFSGGRATVHAVAGPYPEGCVSAAAGYGYWQAVSATGGVFRNICDWDDRTDLPAWDAHFDAFAGHMKSHADTHIALVAAPLPGTLEVRLDGAVTSDGWRYVAEDQAVIVDVVAIGDGVTVDLSYEAAPETCP